MVVGLPVQSVHITTKVVGSTGGWFSSGTSVSSTNKTDRHDITEILLKVVLNTITPNPEIELMIYLTDISFSEKLLI